jgi:hypothetical protein
VAEYLKRPERIVWSRKFFIAERKSYDADKHASLMIDCNNRLYELSGRQICVGDMICISFGCSFPVILRPIPAMKQVVDGAANFVQATFVDETYVYGRT